MAQEKIKEEIEMLTSIAFNNQNAYNWVQRALKKHGYEVSADDIARAIEPAAAEAILELIVDQDGK
jgi:hypothetical protein